jgi:hypothetical protein
MKKIVDMKARIIIANDRYPCVIENLSENEISALTSFTNDPECYQEGCPLKLQFTPPSGEAIDLEGRLKSSFRIPPYGITSNIVVRLDNPPDMYVNLLNSL